jgi:polar amino acid transport system substrate-binding protein
MPDLIRKATIVILILVLVSLIAACRQSEPTPTPEPPTLVATTGPIPTAPPPTDTPMPEVEMSSWERIQAAGKIVVGVAADYPPFEFYNDDFELDGFDIALMQEIGNRLNLEVEFEDIAFDGLGDALAVDQIDLAISAISATPGRAESVDFSNIYLVTTDAILGRSDSELTVESALDLVPRKVGVQRFTVHDEWITTTLIEPGLMSSANLFEYQNAEDMVAALGEGEIDLAVLDFPPAQVAVDSGDFRLVASDLNRQRYALAMAKGARELQAEVNQALTDLQITGMVNNLAEEYLGIEEEEITDIPDVRPPVSPGPPPDECHDGMRFIADVNLDDENMTNPPQFAPGTPFVKIWRVQNSGTCTWSPTYTLRYVGGNNSLARMGGSPVPMGRPVAPGEQIDITASLVAPLRPGTYQGFWAMFNDDNQSFGSRIWVGITVISQATATPQPTATASPNITFSADRTTVNQGECAVLTWDVQNVQAVYLYPQGEPWQQYPTTGQGTRTVCPNTTTTYELRVINTNGSTEIRQITIQVIPAANPPVIQRFTVEPPYQIFAGQCVQITWQVEGTVNNVRLTRNGETLQDNAAASGSRQDCPPGTGEQIYAIQASGPGGTSTLQQYILVVEPTTEPPTPTATPEVNPPAILAFTVTPNQVAVGQCVQIYWNTGGGTNHVQIKKDNAVVLDGAPLTGQTQDCPAAAGTVTYGIEARNRQGDVATDSAMVTVSDAAPQNPLANTNWVVSAIDVNGVPLPDTTLTAYFGPDGSLSGNGGCNPFNSSYTVSGTALTIGPVTAGQALCSEEINSQEQLYFSKLQAAAAFEIDSAGQLVIQDSSGNEILRFIRLDR